MASNKRARLPLAHPPAARSRYSPSCSRTPAGSNHQGDGVSATHAQPGRDGALLQVGVSHQHRGRGELASCCLVELGIIVLGTVAVVVVVVVVVVRYAVAVGVTFYVSACTSFA